MRRLFMALITALATTVAALAVAATTPCFAQALQPDVLRKLHDLGYPSDTTIAIQRWRADNGRRETGPLGAEETAALIAQPLPEFFAAMVGNPFTGMGLALRHKTRAEAEQEALKLCRAQGGGATCANPQVVRADQCVAAVGYSVTIDRRSSRRAHPR